MTSLGDWMVLIPWVVGVIVILGWIIRVGLAAYNWLADRCDWL